MIEIMFRRRIRQGAFLVSLATGFFLSAQTVAAAIVLSGNVSFGGAPCALTITQDIAMTITGGLGPDAGISMVVRQWTTSADVFGDARIFTPGLKVSVNIGADIYVKTYLYDHFGTNMGHITPNDGLMYFDFPASRAWASGDLLTVRAGSYSFSGDPDFDLRVAKTFEGDVFLVNMDSQRMSPNVTIPEPSILLFCLPALLPFLLRRARGRAELAANA